ncbi:MAG: hypothetical protein P4L51_18405 [Puia sp.]|nr:hypothetical protein [Puia sp.]
MNKYIRDAGGMLAKDLADGLIKVVRELEAGLLRDVDRFQESFAQNYPRFRKMQQLYHEERYADLYFYTKRLSAGGANSKAAMGELNNRFLEMIDKASKELKKVMIDIYAAAQHEPVFATYKNGEVLSLKDEFYREEEKVKSALSTTDMSNSKAVYIDLWGSVGDRVASELASRLQTHPVSALCLVGCDISDAGVEVLAQAASQNNLISAFCIAGRRISDTGAKAVASASRNCPSLTTLYLNGWEISDSGAKAVADALKYCPLSVFYLSGGKISDEGAIYVAETMKICPLSAFCLGSSKISDYGAVAVANKVKDCPLSAFYIGGNEISYVGATSVAETLFSGGCTSTLSAFCLGVGRIYDFGANRIADAVRSCPLLSAFYLSSEPISGETLAYVLEGMISTIRSVNLRIGKISKEQMGFCLNRLCQSGIATRLKLRFQCAVDLDERVCKEFEAEWNGKFAEFRIVPHIANLFVDEMILGVPK